MSTNVGEIDLSLILNSDKFSSQLKNIDAQADKASSKISASLSKIGKAALAAFSVAAVVKFGKECLNVATETSNAWIGLNSILTGQGKSFTEAKKFINDYISDGLVPLNNAVTAYKNLAARGYSSEQIQKTMTALKNSATFGRQSTYTLGEAVQTASEGLKNENSILVDNAGVTKNVAKMWEDYAKKVGKTTNQLTQQEKIQAEVNGILEETKFQSNDASIYADTFSGKVAQLSQAFTAMKTAIGNVVQPILKMFVPAITTAVNAVTKLFTTIANLFAIFGYKTDFKIASEKMDNLSSSAGNASNAVEGIGDSAKKAAKDMKKSLAGFDEMNVLSDNSNSGSSGSGTSGGNGGLSISTETSKSTEGIENMSNLLNSINFEPLIKAFNNLKSAAEPIITNIKDGLKWLYDNVLVPLAKWTIEGLLPAFLNLVAGALRVLNPLIEAFKPIFTWFWENCLKPIASWTGGIIVSVLNSIAEALDKVGKWMSENQNTVTKMEVAILGFFGAWEVTKLMSFIQQSGGIVKAFSEITKAIWLCTGAKLKDKLETIYLNMLYAKDFVKSIASGTVALIKQAAQWVVNTAMKVADTAATIASTAATVAATAATWLFNAALAVLTSPITLVVAAIAGLIAIVVLLVKNWDKVKEVTKQCWEIIKTTVINIARALKEKISDIFNSIKERISVIWNAIKTVITSVINSIKTTITNGFNNIKNTISNVFNSIRTTSSNIWSNIKNNIVNSVNNIKNGIVNAFQTAYNRITSLFGNIGNFFSGIWSRVRNSFSSLGSNIGNAISNAVKSGINGIISMIQNTINKAIGLINGAINLINKIPGVNIGRISNLNLPRLAQGGYAKANTPQLAVIGDNKTQGEIVAPEGKMLEMILTALKMFKNQDSNQNDKKQDLILNATIPVYVGNRQVAREIKRINLEEDFAYNT